MEKQNYTEWKLAEAKRIRYKGKQTERDLRLAQSKLDRESKEARLRLEKPKCPLKFLQFYVGRDKNRKQHVGGCKGKNRVSDCRAYCRKFIKPAINKIAA